MFSLFLFPLQKLPTYLIPPPLVLWGCSCPQPPTVTSPPWHYTGTKPSQDQGHSLPSKPCKAVLCFIFNDSHSSLHVYSFVWLFSPWEFWGFRLVDVVVLPMGCKPHSAPSVLSLTPPLGNWCSIQWLSRAFMPVFFRLWQSLSGGCSIRLLSKSIFRHPQSRLGLMTVYAMVSWLSLHGSMSVPHFISYEYFVTPSRNDCRIHNLVFSWSIIWSVSCVLGVPTV